LFGSDVILNVLEYLAREKDYLPSLSLDEGGWEVRRQNASALIVAFLEVHLQGFTQGPDQRSATAMNNFEQFRAHILELQGAAEIRFQTRLGRGHASCTTVTQCN